MTLAFKLFVIILMSSIWSELSGIRKALENIGKGGAERWLM